MPVLCHFNKDSKVFVFNLSADITNDTHLDSLQPCERHVIKIVRTAETLLRHS